MTAVSIFAIGLECFAKTIRIFSAPTERERTILEIRMTAPTAARKWMRGERVEWNEKLAAEYEESAMKIKGRLDELTAQINARRNPKGWIDKETERILIRRATLYKMYGDTIHIAHILENYYVDK